MPRVSCTLPPVRSLAVGEMPPFHCWKLECAMSVTVGHGGVTVGDAGYDSG